MDTGETEGEDGAITAMLSGGHRRRDFFTDDAATQPRERRMETVREILARHGVKSVDQMDVNESYSIEVPGFDTLTIEKVAPERISVAHHRV